MKVITLATYRTAKLLHGGQIRLNAIHDSLRRDGFSVRHVSVHTSDEENLDSGELSIQIDMPTQIRLHQQKMRADVHVCSIFDSAPDCYRLLENFINDFDPDVLWLEQPWLWPVVKRYLEENGRNTTAVIYGSQNVEADLIGAAASESDAQTRTKLAREVKRIEEDLCCCAHGIVGVSESDLAHFKSHGKPLLLAQNGVTALPSPGGLEYWKNVYRHMSLGLFVGSAHPPNAEGFAAMIGHDLSYMAPNENIAVIGGVCNLLRNMPSVRENRGLILPRLSLLDNQDAGGLATFFQLTNAVLLPIVSGGGTNLKTAEALYSRKPIVATSRAFRGYERFMDFPSVQISDDAIEFQKNVKKALAGGRKEIPLSHEQVELLEDLLWSRTLSGVGSWTKRLSQDVKTAAIRAAVVSKFAPASSGSHHRRFISEGALLKHMLHDGWHAFEEQGTWSKKRIATLRIPNPFPNSNIGVKLDIEVMVDQGGQNAIDIYTSSAHHLSKICDYKHRKLSFSFTPRPEDLGSGNVIELYLQVQKLFQPKSAGLIGDERLLGCRVIRISLQNGPMPAQIAGDIRRPAGNAIAQVRRILRF